MHDAHISLTWQWVKMQTCCNRCLCLLLRLPCCLAPQPRSSSIYCDGALLLKDGTYSQHQISVHHCWSPGTDRPRAPTSPSPLIRSETVQETGPTTQPPPSDRPRPQAGVRSRCASRPRCQRPARPSANEGGCIPESLDTAQRQKNPPVQPGALLPQPRLDWLKGANARALLPSSLPSSFPPFLEEIV